MTLYAYNLKAGTRFTYVGAFAEYVTCSDASPDTSYPGKVLVEARRGDICLDIRLNSEQEVTVVE